MDPVRWERVTGEFERLGLLSAEERERELTRIDDPELLATLRDLLAAHEAHESDRPGFLERPALAVFSETTAHPRSGTTVGRFRLVRQIGQGGMGTVFEAERIGEDFEQRAAVKIIRRGFENDFLLERFRRERQILAKLEHPNIARLLDGGATDDGLPYLVMELIDGEPIDAWCRSRKLPLRERLRLFQSVCDAVDYAHRHQVIHRDIKPGNILVNGEGIPKLLDFGIAKSLEPETAPGATATVRMASPQFASPEQLTPGAAVTALSDVYSLGVVLRQMTGDLAAPPKLRAAIEKATAADPARRFSSVRQLSDEVGKADSGFSWIRWGLLAAALLLVVAGLTWRFAGKRPAPGSIAVIWFENLSGDPALDWLGAGFAELVSTGLAQSPSIEVISNERVRGVVGRLSRNSHVPAELATKAAEQSNADAFVAGSIVRKDGGIRINVRLQQTASGRILYAGAFDGESPNSVFSLAEQAAAAIREKLSKRSAPVRTAYMTSNLRALEAYLEGRRLSDRFQLSDARKAFDRAIELDPRFVQPYVARADTFSSWNPVAGRRAYKLAEQLAQANPLPDLQQRLLEARILLIEGREAELRLAADGLTRDHPREPEPLLLPLATLQAWPDWRDLLERSEKAIQLDPKDATASGARAVALMGLERWSEAHQEVSRYCGLIESGDWNCQDFSGDVYTREGRYDEALAEFRKIQRNDKQILVLLARGAPGDAALGRQLAPRPDSRSPVFSFLKGNLAVELGALDEAVRQFEDSASAYTNNQLFAFYQLHKAAEIEFESGRADRVLALAGVHDNPWAPGLRAVANRVLNQPAAAEADFQNLHATIEPLLGAHLASGWEQFFRLEAASRTGDPAAVIELAAKCPGQLHPLYALPLGRAYLAAGRLEPARREFDFLWNTIRPQTSTIGLYEQYSSFRFDLARFYSGVVAEKSGRLDMARAAYRDFLTHLGTTTLPQVAQARPR